MNSNKDFVLQDLEVAAAGDPVEAVVVVAVVALEVILHSSACDLHLLH